MSGETLLGRGESVCPECLRRIPAEKIAEGDKVFLVKTCPDHGTTRVLLWEGPPPFDAWKNDREPSAPERCATEKVLGCPFDCGLCPEHRQQTCCVLLEITSRCNLRCPVCFASAGADPAPDPTLERIEEWFGILERNGGHYNIQLSGGEPSLRDDLPEIIAAGRRHGFDYFQLNTNGLRLADGDFTASLKEAGLRCVFLQFDGTEDAVYRAIRGADLLEAKKKAIRNCGRSGIGVVLVPTIVAGVNEGNIGDILRFAVESMPVVRGVHFQPMSYFGRFPGPPPENRVTIPRLLREIERQTFGLMKAAHFLPPRAEHARCSFHGNFLKEEDGKLLPLSRWKDGECCGKKRTAAEENRAARAFVARQWASPLRIGEGFPSAEEKGAVDYRSLDHFLRRAARDTLAVSCMLFQDAWNLELERLKECRIHVMSPEGKLIPFCAYNLTSRSGRSLYRPAQGEGKAG